MLRDFGELSEQYERINALLQAAREQQNAQSIAFYTRMMGGIELELEARSRHVAAGVAPPVSPQQESHQQQRSG